MRTFISFFLCFLFLSVSYNSFGDARASIRELGTEQEQLQQLKDKLGKKRYERLMRKMDRKAAKREAKGSSASDQAIIALLLSVISIIIFPAAIGAVILGANAKKRMKETENYENEGVATAAIVIGAIVIAFWAIIIGVALVNLIYFGA